jgi:threonylcarbamoyladenosine tRNA methylthiotransferase MtaB
MEPDGGGSIGRRVVFRTLGCRMNQHETDALVTAFSQRGYEIAASGDDADVYVINTCTVTNQGDRKSRAAIRQAIRNARKDAVVIATGCMAVSQRDALEAEDGITFVVPNTVKSAIPELVDAHYRGEIVDPGSLPGGVFAFGQADGGSHTRQAVKVQDGCDNFCTYCIVPSVRGRAVSRPARDVLEHVRRVVDTGAREIVITGVNIGRYDDAGTGFDRLMEQILEIPGDYRVRISSMEPEGLTGRFVALFSHPRLCSHLHLCLQSGSDRILLRMRRFYTVAQFMQHVSVIRERYQHFNFTTDMIVGFPGETDADFAETLSVVREVGFGHMHVFKYSRRNDTRADCMEGQIEANVKTERSEQLHELGQRLKRVRREAMLGVPQRLLTERTKQAGVLRGYTEYYHPVLVSAGDISVNQFIRVSGVKVRNDADCTLEGTIIA